MNTSTAKTSTVPAAEDAGEEQQPPTSDAADAVAQGGSPATGEKNGPSVALGKTDALTKTAGSEEFEDLDESFHDEDLDDDAASRGIGAGAGAVVSTALGVVGLVGGWTGKVASERETLIGQIKTSSGGSAAQQISEIYGDSWHTTALVNGIFAILALLVGVYVLVRPAFGAPSAKPQPSWIRSVALGGVVLGAIGLVLSIAMFFDLIVALPST
ncbi:hypothetical protein OHT52_06975 [Streptomyces sp. NBC_00247]|uniref:hypothetical protein n=1 Tax=Streptomyces sp. NBC_00247 TaxID=2975689 RepID=UPI002E2DDFB3|nr:hypothetical protein [Streptomyces sp. NBC_00247]